MPDCIETKQVKCFIQQNGIIRRDSDGRLIGRLVDDFSYDDLEDENFEHIVSLSNKIADSGSEARFVGQKPFDVNAALEGTGCRNCGCQVKGIATAKEVQIYCPDCDDSVEASVSADLVRDLRKHHNIDPIRELFELLKIEYERSTGS